MGEMEPPTMTHESRMTHGVRRRAIHAHIPSFLTAQDSMYRLIQDIREASDAANEIPRSSVAAALRQAEAAHDPIAPRRWGLLCKWVLKPLRIRQTWHAVIGVAVVAARMGDAKVPRASQVKLLNVRQRRRSVHRPPITVEDMMHVIEPPEQSSSARRAEKKITMPTTAR